MILRRIAKRNERLGKRANRVSAKNHVTPGHCVLSNRVLSARGALISENAKSIPMLAAKAPRRRRRPRRGGIAFYKIRVHRALVYRSVWCHEKRGGAGVREEGEGEGGGGGGGTPHKVFRRYIVVGYSFNAAPNGLHMSYGQRKMTNILYSARKNTRASFF
jgi:hypothetical protein